MKYQLVPENPIEEQALNLNCAIKPLFDPFLPVIQSRAIMAANRLGVFEAIGQGKYTVNQLVKKLSLDKECLQLLLRVLLSAGYVSYEKNKYSLPGDIIDTMLSISIVPMTGWMEHNYHHWHVIDHLEEILRTGISMDDHKNLKDPEKWRIYQQAMMDTSRLASMQITPFIPVKKGATKMVDIGGSHGRYGAHICFKNPPMKSVVLELPDAVEHARKIAADECLNSYVSHKACDVLTDDIGSDYDLAFFGNIIHHFTDDQNRDLLKRSHDSLTDNATIAIWDFISPEPDSAPDLIGDGLALMFRISSNARCYTSKDYQSMLKKAGFTDIIIHPIPAPSQILITGRK